MLVCFLNSLRTTHFHLEKISIQTGYCRIANELVPVLPTLWQGKEEKNACCLCPLEQGKKPIIL